MQSPTLSPIHSHPGGGDIPSSSSSSASVVYVVTTTMISHFFNSPIGRWMGHGNNDTLSDLHHLPNTPPPPPPLSMSTGMDYSVLLLRTTWQWIVTNTKLGILSSTNVCDIDNIDGTNNDDRMIPSSATVTTTILSWIMTILLALFLAFGLHAVVVSILKQKYDNDRVNKRQQPQQRQSPPQPLSSSLTSDTTNTPLSSSSSIGNGRINSPLSSSSSTTSDVSVAFHHNHHNNNHHHWSTIFIYDIVQSITIAARVYIGMILMELIFESCPLLPQQQLYVFITQYTTLLQQFLPSTLLTTWSVNHHNPSHHFNHSNHNHTATTSSNASASSTTPNTGTTTTTTTTTLPETISGGEGGAVVTAATASLLGSFRLREAAPMVAHIVWIGLTVIAIKRILLLQQHRQQQQGTSSQSSSSNPNNQNSNSNGLTTTTAPVAVSTTIPKISGRMILLNRTMDIIIYVIMTIYIIHEISIDTTTSHIIVQTLLSAGGISALIVSFLSKDFATEIVGGVALGIYDIYHVGDRVRIDTNLSGKILQIGFVETTIQGYDNIITRVPNSQLTKSRISNLSRCPRSRLRQNIRIKYSDIDKLPALLINIKEEIILSCPKVISDGSKSFHTVMSSFEADHIQVMVLAHFDIPPVTAEFIRNRHDVLFAIHRAMKKHSIEFAIPPILYANNNYTTTGSSTNSPTNGKDPADYSY